MCTSQTGHFYPRSPCGERHGLSAIGCPPITFLSTLSLRRATTLRMNWPCGVASFLSTLSLRRATICAAVIFFMRYNFYPRSPCGERRRLWARMCRKSWYFYPRSPCGERPAGLREDSRICKISIHALLAESDRVMP